jgi:long-subunit acyl-CoA synthetase (AMP-forming)
MVCGGIIAHGYRGPAVPVSDVRIVDPETRTDLSIGRTGLLLVRGPQVMKCYYNNAGEFTPCFWSCAGGGAS